MRWSKLSALLAPLALAATPAQAVTVTDATGDFLPTYVGPALADLDVTRFSVDYSPTTTLFTIGASFAGPIDPTTVGFYVFGVNTGTGTIRPFASLGQENVIFNRAIVIRKDGTGSIGATALDPATISIAGNSLTATVALSLLPTTGFAPEQYGFNIWPRIGNGNNNQITDFSPENATLAAAAAVPEPTTWALFILGFGATGGVMRSRRSRPPAALA